MHTLIQQKAYIRYFLQNQAELKPTPEQWTEIYELEKTNPELSEKAVEFLENLVEQQKRGHSDLDHIPTDEEKHELVAHLYHVLSQRKNVHFAFRAIALLDNDDDLLEEIISNAEDSAISLNMAKEEYFQLDDFQKKDIRDAIDKLKKL